MNLFVNPITQSALAGALLISLPASILGVFLFLRKKTMIGEVLAHAAFPGIIVGLFTSIFSSSFETQTLFATVGALLFALLGFCAIILMKKSRFTTDDSSHSFVLASFFGIGVLLLSYLQHVKPVLSKRAGNLFFGQLATLDDRLVAIFFFVAFFVALLSVLFFKELKLIAFDTGFSKSHWGNKGFSSLFAIDLLFYLMVASITVVGVRVVGMVLVSSMFIGPAIAARQYTNRLSIMVGLSLFFALLATLLGSYLSLECTFTDLDGKKAALPPGPAIVLLSSLIAFISILFAPKRGLLFCYLRHWRFRASCFIENIVKLMWKMAEQSESELPSPKVRAVELRDKLHRSKFSISLALRMLLLKGYLKKDRGAYQLTDKGRQRGATIVRLHRLWEKYLVDCLGAAPECVHKSAEEIEHILNAELEAELVGVLDNPTLDPHQKPIPFVQKISRRRA